MRQLAYVLLVAAASPALVTGYLLTMWRGFGEARRSGMSITAANALSNRTLLHRLGRRPDPVAAALPPRVP